MSRKEVTLVREFQEITFLARVMSTSRWNSPRCTSVYHWFAL